MTKKAFKLAAIGFVMGMIAGNVIALITSYASLGRPIPYSEYLLAKAGSPVLAFIIQTLLSGVLGAIAMAGSVLYELDSWGMTKVVIVHYLMIIVTYVSIGLALGWFRFDLLTIAFSIAMMAAAYFMIWLIMYLRYKREVNKLNRLIGKKKDRPSE